MSITYSGSSVAVRQVAHLDLAPATLGASDGRALATDYGLEQAQVELRGATAGCLQEMTSVSVTGRGVVHVLGELLDIMGV